MAAKQKRTKTTPSSVCRVNKNTNYTVMSNYHLRSMNLSLKAIGLLSKVLSLPAEWDYSISGLTSICKEKETAIKAALDELKFWGYLKVTKLMPNETASGRIEYVYDFYEYSEKDKPDSDQNADDTYGADEDAGETAAISQKSAKQGTGKQGIENLPLEILPLEIQAVENQGQINTDKKIKRNQLRSNQIPINQSPSGNEMAVETVEKQTDGLIDGYAGEQQIYTEVVKSNIDFDEFRDWLTGTNGGYSVEDDTEAEEIVQMIVRAICSRKRSERICGQEFPREIVKSAMLKVDITCLQNAIEQMQQTGNIRNYEQYLISTLFNEANSRHFKENAEGRWADFAVKRDFG